MTAPRSPLPWPLTPTTSGGALLHRKEQTLQIYPMEDAEFIHMACHNHDALVLALSNIMDELSQLDGKITGKTAQLARQALAAARGQS